MGPLPRSSVHVEWMTDNDHLHRVFLYGVGHFFHRIVKIVFLDDADGRSEKLRPVAGGKACPGVAVIHSHNFQLIKSFSGGNQPPVVGK